MRDEGCYPIVGFEESHQAAVAACGQEGNEFRGCEDVLFFYFQGFFVNKIIHAIPVLAAPEKAPFFIQVHQGSGDPQSIALGNNEIIDVGVLIREVFGQGTGDAYTAYVGELVKEAGYFVRDKEQLVRVLVAFDSSKRQLGVVL